MINKDEQEILVFQAQAEDKGQRLDKWLSQKAGISRTYVQKLIADRMITCADYLRPASYRLKGNERILLEVPESEELELLPEPMDLDIIYEDEDLLVVNKPKSLVVHPAPGNWTGTLVNGLLAYQDNWPGISGVFRPGIVHRLDKDTSGLMVVAKSDVAAFSLSQQLKEQKVKRLYLTLTWGNWPSLAGLIDAPIGRHPKNRQKMWVVPMGKKSQTDFQVIQAYANTDFLKVQLRTGRTHQIRVHMAYYKHPIIGDMVYGNRESPWPLEGQALHAYALAFYHPQDHRWMEFRVQPPQEFMHCLNNLGYDWDRGVEIGELDFIDG